MERTSALSSTRAVAALRRPGNWVQLAKFCAVGASGFGVNIGVYALLLNRANLHYLAAATVSFVVAATNNYVWNRYWTFRGQRGHVVYQGMRFFVVSAAAAGANLGLLGALVALGSGKVIGQAIAIVLVMPLNFIGNKLWSFRSR
jgi:putative flippase GtrA